MRNEKKDNIKIAIYELQSCSLKLLSEKGFEARMTLHKRRSSAITVLKNNGVKFKIERSELILL